MKQIVLIALFVVTACGNAAPVSEPLALMATEDASQQPQRVTRGMLFRGPQCCNHRAQAIAVRVTHPKYGPSSFAYSGQDGMYYLYNVPAGDFTLEIWLTNDPNHVQRQVIRVTTALVNDIPPIRVP